MELYDSIFMRKSIRKFKEDKLSDDQRSDILGFASEVQPLFPDIKVSIQIFSPEEVKGMMGVKAPQYLLIFSEDKDGKFLNAGFILQQMDLFLSSLGIGSCWLGMTKPKDPTINGLKYMAMLAIGMPDEPLHRKSIAEFDRKPIEEISQGADPRLESARLAPSATNGQPWYFICGDDNILVYRKKSGMLKNIVFDRLTQLDLGIALCHIMIAGKKLDIPFSFIKQQLPDVDGYDGMGIISGTEDNIDKQSKG